MTITITRASATRYDVHAGNRHLGAGTTLQAAQRIAARHHRNLHWTRTTNAWDLTNQPDSWTGQPASQTTPFGGRTHGIERTYNAGCHCAACTKAATLARSRRRGNVLPAAKLSA